MSAGISSALAAAVLFGLSAPVSKLLLPATGPLLLAERHGEGPSADDHLQRVPGARRRLDAAHGLEDRPLPAHDAEEEEIVLERVRAGTEVGAVRRDAPREPRSLIDAPGLGVEPHG